jgi:hydroxysqualene dehydroxylase
MSRVVIIGGGFAGLAAGVALAESGHTVEILERRAFLGGRAYSFFDPVAQEVIDNGQHLMMGCYHETFQFLRRLGTLDQLAFQERSRVDFVDQAAEQTTFECMNLPAPLHLLSGLLRLKGFSWRDKLATLRLGSVIRASQGSSDKFSQMTVEEFLTAYGQSPRMKERFWNVFSIATLNEQPDVAAASLLVKVLQQAFGGSRADSAMVVAKVGLSEIYTEQARAFIEQRGGAVRLRAIAEKLMLVGEHCQGVKLQGGELCQGDFYISAIPYFALRPLLPPNVAKVPYFADWDALRSAPIVSINLWFDRSITKLGFAGLLGGQLQWLFNKNALIKRSRFDTQHISLVISAAHELAEMPKEQLVEMALQEVQQFFPAAKKAQLRHFRVIKEHQATFSASVAAEQTRPNAKTPFANLLLAGDWTNTGLPATIESAVLSGHRCAAIINQAAAPTLSRGKKLSS